MASTAIDGASATSSSGTTAVPITAPPETIRRTRTASTGASRSRSPAQPGSPPNSSPERGGRGRGTLPRHRLTCGEVAFNRDPVGVVVEQLGHIQPWQHPLVEFDAVLLQSGLHVLQPLAG